MTAPFTFVDDICNQAKPPRNGILSQTIHQDSGLKAIVFHFSAGQELSEHQASVPAVLHFLNGEAEVTLGPERVAAKTGTWIHISAQLPHSIRTTTPVTMLLQLLK